MQACVDVVASDAGGIFHHFFIQPDGSVKHHPYSCGAACTTSGGARPDFEKSLDRCFERVLEGTRFPAARNKMAVSFEWAPDRSVREYHGTTVEPLDCERERYPCSFADADPERQTLAQQYADELQRRIDCAKPQPAIEWLKRQRHVRTVQYDGCTVRFLVEGARPVWLLAPHPPRTR
jgi:hypothetical protein